MCLIFIALKHHPSYKLVVATNRDEFYSRKTAPAEVWPDYPHILGGRDLEAGGTWLGMTKNGRLSMITNYRDPKNINPAAPSRGQLVSDFLTGHNSAFDYLKEVAPFSKQYNGFNLIVGTVDELLYFSNYREGVGQLGPGLYGLSNHLLETPWPKIKRGKQKMTSVLKSSVLSPDMMFDALYDDTTAADELLPDTGIGLTRERALSSMFIKSPGYGTRCSTVILVDHQDHVIFSERVYDVETFEHTTKTFRFDLE